MKSRFFDQSRSVIYSWIASYLLLTLVMLVLTGGVYYIANHMIKTEINSSNQLLLENIRGSIDDSLDQVNDLSMEILADDGIRAASGMDSTEFGFYYQLYQAARGLSNYKVFKNPLQSYYIYLERTDRIVTPGVVNFSEVYYGEHLADTGLSYEGWLDVIGRQYDGRYVTLPFRESGDGRGQGAALIRSIPSSWVGGRLANIVVMLDFDSVLDYGNENRALIILDSENQVLAQSGDSAAFDPSDLPAMEDGHGMLSRRTESGKEVISYIASGYNDWKYITVTPDSVYWERSFFIRTIMVGEIVLCLIGMGLLAFYFVRRNYNILREITSFVRSQSHTDAAFGGNEYEYIQRALSVSFEQKEEFEDKLDKQNRTLRASMLTCLLRGWPLPHPPEDLFAMCGIDFPHPRYAVVAIRLERVNRALWLSGASKEFDVFRLARVAVRNILEEVVGRKHSACVVETEDRLCCLVNTAMEQGEWRASLNADLTDARDFINQHLDVDLALAVSALHESPEGFHGAYLEAESAIAYAEALGRGRTIFFDELASSGEGAPSSEAERKLRNYVRLSDGDAAVRALREVLRPSYGAVTASARFSALALAVRLLRSVSEDDGEFAALAREHGAALERLMDAPVAASMCEPLEALARALSRPVAREKRGDDLGATMRAYIREHYRNPNLNVSSLAEAIGKSPYYASRLFKEQTGVGILDELNQVRVDAAKLLIRENLLTQEQIAERVGFTNVRTFQRIFKKLEGVPPGKLKPLTSSAI